jgi:crotonobetainyl-CoA:carnitine CoA-transferase CaiB-like acyl-CoA transferase
MNGWPASPYGEWPALAAVVEAMSGIYELKREPGKPPTVSPMGALGDISTALFSTIGILCALRLRDATGKPQRVDVAMFDVLVAMTDIVVNFASLGVHGGLGAVGIMHGFQARDGYFILQVIREHQWAGLCDLIGRPEWKTDDRFANRAAWTDLLEPEIRPAVEAWAASRSKLECCDALTKAGLIAGPCFSADEVMADPHLADRHMLVAMDRTDGEENPVLTPGNPIKFHGVPEGPESRVPWLGEHTRAVLEQELNLESSAIDALFASGVVA